MERPASPFIDEGKGAGYTREREGEREKPKEEGLWGRSALHLLCTGPAGPIDDDGGGSMS